MIISCTHCGTKFSAADSKVMNKKFAFNCPSCNTEVTIDNRENKDEEVALKKPVGPARKTILDELPPEEPSGIEEIDIDIGDDLDSIEAAEEDLSISNDELPNEEIPEEDLLDNIDIKPGKPASKSARAEAPDDGIVSFNDFGADDSLELELDQIVKGEKASDEDELTADEEADIVDGLNLDFEEEPAPKKVPVAARKAAAAKVPEPDEEELNLNINDLDISELPSDEEPVVFYDDDIIDEKITVDDVESEEILAEEPLEADTDDTDITIDLDSLDIQLEEMEAGELMPKEDGAETEELDLTSFDEPQISRVKPKPAKTKKMPEPTEDEDITLDLDSLDLNLDETGETMEGEDVDEDERLTLADAGLTPDEIAGETSAGGTDHEEDEEIKINIDDVSADIPDEDDVESSLLEPGDKGKKAREFEEIDLADLEMDDVEMEFEEEPEIEPIEEMEISPARMKAGTPGRRASLSEIEDIKQDASDTVPRGAVNFSIDYSMKFSRLGAILRLTQLFTIGLLPHMIINILYSLLSGLIGVINNLIIIITGDSVDDYTEIHENTLRRLLSTGACLMGIVEEMPVYSGRKSIDYPLQFEVTYPVKYSRLLAFSRLSIIGILLITLPHLLMLFVLTIGSIPICLVGLVCVIIRKAWPNILFDPMVKYLSYASSVLSYIIGLVDKYPRFRLE